MRLLLSATTGAEDELRDLPDMLASHQVPTDSGEYAGSFCHRFDHVPVSEDFEPASYTEDTIFGLIAADNAGVEWDFYEETLGAKEMLCLRVTSDGIVYEHIWSGGALYYTYGGEVLEAIR